MSSFASFPYLLLSYFHSHWLLPSFLCLILSFYHFISFPHHFLLVIGCVLPICSQVSLLSLLLSPCLLLLSFLLFSFLLRNCYPSPHLPFSMTLLFFLTICLSFISCPFLLFASFIPSPFFSFGFAVLPSFAIFFFTFLTLSCPHPFPCLFLPSLPNSFFPRFLLLPFSFMCCLSFPPSGL